MGFSWIVVAGASLVVYVVLCQVIRTIRGTHPRINGDDDDHVTLHLWVPEHDADYHTRGMEAVERSASETQLWSFVEQYRSAGVPDTAVHFTKQTLSQLQEKQEEKIRKSRMGRAKIFTSKQMLAAAVYAIAYEFPNLFFVRYVAEGYNEATVAWARRVQSWLTANALSSQLPYRPEFSTWLSRLPTQTPAPREDNMVARIQIAMATLGKWCRADSVAAFASIGNQPPLEIYEQMQELSQ